MRESDYHGRSQKKTFALREPDLKEFSAEEIDLVNRILEEYRGMNASHMTKLTHAFIGWKLARDGEVIPYTVALVGNRDLTQEEIEYGKSLAEDAKKCLGV